jgi:transcriptional regulator with XRE-family HTH domain
MMPVQLKKWRRENGYSQNQLAKVLDVDVMTVSRWERGVRSIPPFLHLALECLKKRESRPRCIVGAKQTSKKKGGQRSTIKN